MSDKDDRSEEGIYRADTVPPPDGDDAYNAVTRVGPMAATVVNEMIVAARARDAAEHVPGAKGKPRSLEGVDGGELDDRDIEAELDPTGFPSAVPPGPPPSLRPAPVPVFSTPPLPVASTPSHAPLPSAAPLQGRSAAARLPLIIVACAAVATMLMALAYGIVVTLGR